jgi:uncharacterized protein YukE
MPLVERQIERWTELDRHLGQVDSTLDELVSSPATTAELADHARAFRQRELRGKVAQSLGALNILRTRLSRPTVNIGVSGQARVGKSTLLQTIAGLTDEQVPTGEGIPVTAVRSRIFHSTVHERATLQLHSYESFRDEVLGPYHRALGLGLPAGSLEGFRRYDYTAGLPAASPHDGAPAQPGKSADPSNKHSLVTLGARLRDMQRALPSYEHDLTGGERVIPLTELRQYVAYPTKEQEDAPDCARRYLAVRDVRIECRFPEVEVEDLALIDLPGLGELAAGAERHHVEGLQHEVDVVLLVKRPVEGMAYWTDADGRAVDLLDEARGAVSRRNDFVFIIVNEGSVKMSLVDALLGDIRRRANEGVDGKHYPVLRCDALDQSTVYRDTLGPVLEHLAERLPVMDREVIEDAVNKCKAASEAVRAALDELREALSEYAPEAVGASEQLYDRAAELRLDVAQGLDAMVRELFAEARGGAEDERLVAAVQASYQAVRDWVAAGFGKGKDAWVEAAVRAMRAENNSSPFAARELNKIRVSVSERYSAIDNHLHERVEELRQKIAALLAKCFGGLLAGLGGTAALNRLAALLDDATEPCPNLASAVQNLLELDIRYSSHLHPRVRRALDGLNYEIIDPQSGTPRPRFLVDVSAAGAAQMFQLLGELAEQAAYETRKSLLEEIRFPTLVLHAAGEQFQDSLIRTGDSEREFRRFARSYRDEIWPGVFDGIEAQSARIGRVKRAVREAQLSATSLGEGLAGAAKANPRPAPVAAHASGRDAALPTSRRALAGEPSAASKGGL